MVDVVWGVVYGCFRDTFLLGAISFKRTQSEIYTKKSQKVVFVHQLTLGHNDMAWVFHKTRKIGKDFMEHKNPIKQKILVVEAFCRAVDMHN